MRVTIIFLSEYFAFMLNMFHSTTSSRFLLHTAFLSLDFARVKEKESRHYHHRNWSLIKYLSKTLTTEKNRAENGVEIQRPWKYKFEWKYIYILPSSELVGHKMFIQNICYRKKWGRKWCGNPEAKEIWLETENEKISLNCFDDHRNWQVEKMSWKHHG